MGDFGNFVGVSVHPSGTVLGVGEFKFVEINICIEYMLPTILGIQSVKYICWYWINHNDSWGDECKGSPPY